ncbi:MAG: hypothetical protein MAG453_01932 [Calditrichaeota bacterium]|nr:hypothetical protein [Calditrichota bacterium]
MAGTRFVRLGDAAVIVALVAAAVALAVAAGALPGGANAVVIVDGETEAVLPIGEPAHVEVEGPLGTTVIDSDADGVRIVSSPCPHKLCVSMGPVRVRGQAAVCVPNRVAVRVEGDAGAGVDGVVG